MQYKNPALIIIVALILIGAIVGVIMALNNAPVEDGGIVLPEDFPETGTVLDITEQNGGSALLVPGDIIYVKLIGEAASQKQWTVTSPTSGESLVLMEHKLIDLNNEEVEFFTDEWWLKVVAPDTFILSYEYGKPLEEVEQVFTFDITIQ